MSLTLELRAQAHRDFYALWDGWRAKVKRSPSVWATQERRLASGGPLAQDEDIAYDHAVMPHAVEAMDAADDPDVNILVLWWARRMAKALALDTPIPTVHGWKQMGRLVAGDVLFDETGRQCRVIRAKEIMLHRPCMEVFFDDGTSIIADESHDWFTLFSRRRSKGPRRDRTVRVMSEGGVRTTKQIADTLKTRRGNSHAIPLAAPLELGAIDVKISPYVLGLWLGDGDHATARISSSLSDAGEIMRLIESEGHKAKLRIYRGSAVDIKIDDRVPGKRFNAFIQPVRELGMLKNKHIPSCFLRASFNQRLALMQGLMDSDGSIAKDGTSASFTSVRPALAEGFMELARTLGLKPTIRERITRCQTGATCRSLHVTFFPSLPVFRLTRKLARVRPGKAKSSRERRIVRVVPVESVPVRCIEVDSVNHLFLAGIGMIPTHNSEGVCMNIIGRNVVDFPVNMISMWPVEDSRDRFSRDCVEKTIEATTSLSTAFVQKKSRDSGRTIDFKRFHGGSLIINYSGSKSQTKGMAAGAVFAHEVDAYPVSSQGEGDPVSKLFGRTEGFADAIKIVESTGTLSSEQDPLTGKKIYHSNIELWYDRSDQRKWFCPCRVCGRRHWLKWEQIRKLDKKSGDLFFYLCEECDADHNERQWRKMVSSGLWMPTAPFRDGIRGYWINGFNSLLPTGKGFRNKLHQFKAEGERALSGKPEEKQVWINEVKTELISLSEDAIEPPAFQAILDGREDYATAETTLIPKKALVLTCATDLHPNRLEIDWRAWAKDEESWGVGHFVLFGDTNRPDVWLEWATHLQKKFPHESGASLSLSLAFIDGGWNVDPILATLLRIRQEHVPGVSGKILISKGVPEWTAVIFRTWGTIKDKAKGVHIGTWRAKSLIYERLRWHSAKDKPSSGFIHFGKIYSDDFIRQTVSEKSVMQIIKGKEIETFKNPEKHRNEALDLLVMNLAAFRRRLWDFETIEKTLKEEAAKANRPAREEKVAEKIVTPKRGPFGNRGWAL